MNVETKIDTYTPSDTSSLDSESVNLIRQGLSPLEDLAEKREKLRTIFDDILKVGDRATLERARKLSAKLDAVEPAVTMIGQVKAGKTSLVNAMIGMPDLLPSDVNPWTSVVTSLHLDPAMSASQNRSSFQFFDREDWDRLVVGGGRIGELARRAGATLELEHVGRQIAALQQKSRERLGKKFELLLGQEHDYGYFDNDLIERYVCLGDDFEDDTETSKTRGRFADITKSAQIHMQNPATPTKLCIRDTPGVNDTFLVREQITIKAIRGSQICVVVLAAHQALSSVDLALLRLISNVKSREIIIFVNRIDELADPASQVPEIRANIAATLKVHQGPEDATIIFGSALWANQLIEGRLTDLSGDSADSLMKYARFELTNMPTGLPANEVIWNLSGLASLHYALAGRINDGPGQDTIAAIMRNARNLLNGIKISSSVSSERTMGAPKANADTAVIAEEYDAFETKRLEALEDGLRKQHDEFVDRIERVHNSFLDRASASLVNHVETEGEDAVWKYDPTGLRMLLRSSYRTFAKRSKDMINNALSATVEESAAFFERSFSVPADSFAMQAPEASEAPAPVILGQTIALDLQSNWWSKWWKQQKGAKAHTKEFAEMIAAETAPIFEGLREDYAKVIRDDAVTLLNEFVAEQKTVLNDLIRQCNAPENSGYQTRQEARRQTRLEIVERASATLEELFGETDG